MNLSEIKNIPIRSYMEAIGCDLKKDYGSYGLYCSPMRKESIPSLKVSFSKNVWVDFGRNNSGGSIIDLVMQINNFSFAQAVDYLINGNFKNLSFLFHRKPIIANTAQSINIISTLPISNKWLIQYLHSRKIPIEIAREYCKEVNYENRGKQYYAIGFPNKSKGYELRNAYFKGCTNKDITIIELQKAQNSDNQSQCLLFEGFFDFLSYLTLKAVKSINQKVLVLNSLSNIKKAIPILKKNNLVIGYLDNDESGKNGMTKLISHGINIKDGSLKYAPYKDLNEYLIFLSGEENKVNR